MSAACTVAEIWRYPVKSMGGERVAAAAIAERGVHADRMWAVRDVGLGTFTTARRWPVLLQCSARFAEDPAGRPAGPGDVLDVHVTFPDGTEASSADPEVHERLSALIGKPARLEPLPALSDRQAYRTPQATKADLRRQFLLPEDAPPPDLSTIPVRRLAELARYATPVGALYDLYPLHVLTRASLRAMEREAPQAHFDVRRFRPNVVLDLDGAELAEFAWCGGRLRGTSVTIAVDVPTVRCSMPTREQGDLAAEPDVLRTINAVSDHCLGVYATVARGGVLAEGEVLAIEPPRRPSAATTFARTRGRSLKRGALRAMDALLPRGQ